MSKEEFDWEDANAAAWREFRVRLADQLAQLEDDDVLLLDVESSDQDGGATPYVQFCTWGEGQLRCEAVSNTYLAPGYRLDADGVGVLEALGYAAPTWTDPEEADSGSANFWIDLPQREADRAAVVATRTLREVYGVVHPAFVSGLAEAEAADARPSEPTVPESQAEPAVYPTDGFDQLQALVDETLTPWLGHAPVHDDGDIPIDCGGVIVFVRVLPGRPMVRMFTCLAYDVADRERARVEVDILNRDRLCFKFLLLGDSVVMHCDVPAWPFAPSHLRDLVQEMCSSVGQLQGDLEARIGAGDIETDPEDWNEDDASSADADDDLHPAMQTLLELEADASGSVSPRLAAAICDHDRDTVLELLSWTHGHDVDRAAEITALLRAALRVVVDEAAARWDSDRSPRAGGRPLPPKPRRRTNEDADSEMRNR